MDYGPWAAAPAVGAAFLASLVEVVEAFTIILPVGTLTAWPTALEFFAAATTFCAASANELALIMVSPL